MEQECDILQNVFYKLKNENTHNKTHLKHAVDCTSHSQCLNLVNV